MSLLAATLVKFAMAFPSIQPQKPAAPPAAPPAVPPVPELKFTPEAEAQVRGGGHEGGVVGRILGSAGHLAGPVAGNITSGLGHLLGQGVGRMSHAQKAKYNYGAPDPYTPESRANAEAVTQSHPELGLKVPTGLGFGLQRAWGNNVPISPGIEGDSSRNPSW